MKKKLLYGLILCIPLIGTVLAIQDSIHKASFAERIKVTLDNVIQEAEVTFNTMVYYRLVTLHFSNDTKRVVFAIRHDGEYGKARQFYKNERQNCWVPVELAKAPVQYLEAVYN